MGCVDTTIAPLERGREMMYGADKRLVKSSIVGEVDSSHVDWIEGSGY